MTIRDMNILDRSGHMNVQWDPDKEDEVNAARATFDKMKSKGYSAFVSEGGEKGKRLERFDPSVEEMILTPPIQGG